MIVSSDYIHCVSTTCYAAPIFGGSRRISYQSSTEKQHTWDYCGDQEDYFHSIHKIKSQFYSKHFMTPTVFGAIIFLSNIQSTQTTLTLAERAHLREILCYALHLSIPETKEAIRITSRQEISSKMKCKPFVRIMIHMKRHPRCDYINIINI